MDRPTPCHWPWRVLSLGTLLLVGCGQGASPAPAGPEAGSEPRRLELTAADQPPRPLAAAGILPAGYPPAASSSGGSTSVADNSPSADPAVAPDVLLVPDMPPAADMPLMPASPPPPPRPVPPAAEAAQQPAAEAADEPAGPPALGYSASGATPLAAAQAPAPAMLAPAPVSRPLSMAPGQPQIFGLPSPAANGAAAMAPAPAAALGVRSAATMRSAAMDAVNRRAEQLIDDGVALAERRAMYSARAKFLQALRLLAEAQDAQAGSDDRVRALAAGLTALRESRDFRSQRASAERGLDVAYVAAAHRTPILKGERQVTPLAATQRYLTYARKQLEIAAGQEPAASFAMYGLGRVAALAAGRDGSQALGDPGQAMVFYQASLAADPRNFRAANELGVLLGDFGRWEAARDMFVHALSVSQQPAAWRNLAVAYDRLGQPALAAQAKSHVPQGLGPTPEVRLQWLDPAAFARTRSATDASLPPQGTPNLAPAGNDAGTAAQPGRGAQRF